MTIALSQSTLWLTGVLVALLAVVVVLLLRRRRGVGRMKFHSSLPAEGLAPNDISMNNVSLNEVKGMAGLEDTSLYCDIVQRDGGTFRVQKAKMDRYDVPLSGNELAIFVALKELEPFEEKVWYLVEERGTSLHVLGLASQTHPGLIHAFEIIARAGKQPHATLNSADQALLKNFGWGIQDVNYWSPQDRPKD
ncbi:MAG: hypothetical protein IPJ08_15515 [Burkholderiales bacterium]|nr:hypothetical protein [Burkholderiales bacterium]